jgi:hypothetical protein
MRRRILAIVVLLLCSPFPCRAGGPQFVAGSGFDAAVQGQPLIWPNGQVQYFTDQGDLSPVLNGSQADAFVADAFTRWTSTTGVTLTTTLAGRLAEDVSGANVIGFPDGTYTVPADIQPGALSTPVGIVYDRDGKVTDALLGIGAGGVSFCFTNAVSGGLDNFSTDGHLAHALVVINGVCAANNALLPDVRYRLVRALGRVLGMGWSQANLNVILRNPVPGADDFQGFSLMHFLDPVGCVPIGACYPDADVPKMDDRAMLRRLYAAAPRNPELQQPQATVTRIHGSVFFTDASGNRAQPMQGVNVVARLIDEFDKMRAVVLQIRQSDPKSRLASEEYINKLGYSLVSRKKHPDAIAVLRMNTEDFPKSANTWDSLADAQFQSGDVPHAIENYTKALVADPKYANAKAATKFLAEHEKGK